MLLKNLINSISKEKTKIVVSGLSTNSKEIKKIIFFLRLKEIRLMAKNILTMQYLTGPQLLFAPIEAKLKIKAFQ